MQKLVVCTFAAVVVGLVAACSSSSDDGLSAGLGAFTSAVMTADSSPVVVHVYHNPDFSVTNDTVPAFLASDDVDRTPTITILPQNVVVPNGTDNVTASFSDPSIADLDGNGFIEGLAPGTTVMTWTFTDFNHNNATQSINIPITVVVGPAPGRLVH